MSDKPTPWLEPGAGEQVRKLSGPNNTVAEDAAMIEAGALLSLAITFKRLVDMAAPFVEIALAEIAAQKKAGGK